MRSPTKIIALRRAPNCQLAAIPVERQPLLLLAQHRASTMPELMERAGSEVASDGDQGSIGPHGTCELRGRYWRSISLWGRRSHLRQLCRAQVAWRLICAVCGGQQRGLGSFGAQASKAPRFFHAQGRYLRCAVLPNPSLKRSDNGRPRQPSSAGPAAHFALAVRRVLPLSPA